MNGLGTHILLDLYGCDPGRLDDLQFLRRMSMEGVQRSGATIVGDHFKQFHPQGVSGIIVIAESHLSLHTWPEFSYIAMDYFTCGGHIDIDAAIDYFVEQLSPKKVVKSRHDRGGDLKGKPWAGPSQQDVRRPSPWFTEYHWDGEKPERLLLGFQYAVDREIVRTRSAHQEILVLDNPVYGRMLFLDGILNTAEKDEFAYHEMLSHVPLTLHGSARRILIVGGGDGGLLREVLRHPTVESVDLVEIDEEVLKVAQDHLPGDGKAFQDSRVRIHIQDGSQFVRDISGLYDVILVDSTDPMGPGKVLYERDFYRHCKEALREGGIFGAQALSAWIQQREQEAMFQNLREIWSHVLPYLVTVPTYPGALWTFALGSQRPLRPDAFDPAYAESISKLCRYYNPEVHRSAFALPNFLKDRLLNGGPRRH